MDWRLKALVAVIVMLAAFAVAHSRLSTPMSHAGQGPHAGTSSNEGAEKDRPVERKSLLERTAEDPVALFTALLTIFTGLLFLATCGLWSMAVRADELARASAAAARDAADVAREALVAQSRAWLKVEAVLAGQPLFFDRSGGVGTGIQLRITNIGNEPALNIRPIPWLYVKQMNCFMTDSERVSVESERFRLQENGLRFSLFPGETIPSSMDSARTSGTGADAADIEGGQYRYEGRPVIHIQICGCVTYQTPSDPGRHHQTRFLSNLKTTDTWHFVVGEDVPADLLVLQDDTASLGNHAD